MSDVGGFILGAVATAGGVALSFASFGLATPLSMAMVSFGVGQMGRSLFGGDRMSASDMQANAGSPDATLPVIYGTAKIGMKIYETRVFDGGDREHLFRGGAVCVASEDGSGIEGFERVWFDDVLAIDTVADGTESTASGVEPFFDGDTLYSAFRGTDSQTVSSMLQDTFGSSIWGNNAKGVGIAHFVFRWHKNKEVFPRVPNVAVEVKGNRVYDPRDGTWKFTNNPALCLLDYLTSARYGAELFYPERDGGDTSLSEIDEQSFIDAANFCEEQVQDGSGGTQDRFTFDGWLDTGTSLDKNVDALLSAMRGEIVHQAGKFRLVIRQTKTPVMTLTEDEIIGDWTFRRAGARKVPNRVAARYAGGTAGDLAEEVQFPEPGDTTFLDQDGGHPQTMQMDLVGVQDPVRAEQIAMVGLRESRRDAAVSVKCRASALQLEVGDVVTVDHETPGWTGSDTVDFWVVEMTLVDDDTVLLKLKEYADSAYSLDAQTRPTPPPGSNLPDPTTTGAPTNLALTSDGTTQVNLPGGDKVPGIEATWDLPTDKGIDRVVVLERENGAADWNRADTVEPTDTQRSLFAPKGATQGDTWQVGVKVVVGQRQLESTVTTATVTLSTDFVATDTLQGVVNEDLQESDFDTDGVTEGRLTLEVVADSGTYDVQFDTRQGRGTGWTTASNPTGLTTGSTTSQDVELTEGKLSFIRYEVFVGGTSDSLGRRVVQFDPDNIAEVGGVSATIDDTSKQVIVSASGDSDTDKIHVRVGLNSDPLDPDGTASDDGTISARSGTVDTGVTAGDQDTAHIKARGVNTAGDLGPVKETRVALSSGARLPAVDEAVAESGSTGSLDITVEDPETRITSVEFQKKTGTGDWGTLSTAWDRSTGTVGSSTTLTRGEDVTLTEKHNVSLRWKVTYTAPSGSSEVLSGTVTYDVDDIAEVRQPELSIDDSGTLTAEVSGDPDTATIYLTQTTDGTEPNDPTSANADQTINSRSGVVTFSSTVPKGGTGRVKARGENSGGSLAGTDTIKSARVFRRDPESTVNLLGEDAGPEHSGTSSSFHEYAGFRSADPVAARIPLEALALEAGEDTISIAADLKSATGADNVRFQATFRDDSNTILATTDTAAVTSSTYVREAAEDISVPSGATNMVIRAQNNDTTEQASVRRAMVNRGPVVAPYTDPPTLESENLLGVDALPERSGTADGYAHKYLDAVSISDLGLEVGDVLSFSADVKSDGTRGVDIRLEARDSSDTLIKAFGSNNFITSTAYERHFIHSAVLPENTALLTVGIDNENATSGEGFGKRAMLNRGPRAAPFSIPKFAFDRDQLPDLPNSKFTEGGDAVQDFQIGGFPFNSHSEPRTGQDGDQKSFNADYASGPEVNVWPKKARTYLSGQSGEDQRSRMTATNVSTSGFDLVGVVQYGTTTTTSHDDGFSSSRNTAAPESGSASTSTDGGAVYSQLEDADGSDLDITVTYDLDASGLVGEFATCTVHVEYSDAATGGNWTEATSRSYTKGQNVTDEQVSLTATMLADYDLRLRLTYSDSSESGNATLTGHGEDGSPPGVQYSVEDATISEATMTPRSADELKFEGKEVSA